MTKNPSKEGLKGKPAFPFTLSDAARRILRLEDYRGKWLLMVFHRDLERLFGMEAQFWLNLQLAWDLYEVKHSSAVKEIKKIKPLISKAS